MTDAGIDKARPVQELLADPVKVRSSMRQRGDEIMWHITERLKSTSCPQLDMRRRSVPVFGELLRRRQGKFVCHLRGDPVWPSPCLAGL